MKIFTSVSAVYLIPAILSLCSCGGGSSDSGMVIEGTLTEAGGAAHKSSLVLKHSVGQRVENVQICALGECSLTDGQGQWGFLAEGGFTGGDVLFSLQGHGIDTTATARIPDGATEVFIDFQHVEGGKIEAHHVTVDGETSHQEESHHD